MLIFCFVFVLCCITVALPGLIFGELIETFPFEDAEIPICVTVSEEKITGKNGGHFDGTIYRASKLNDEELKAVITSIESNLHWQKGMN